jgi:hypothetical protein
MGCLAIGHDELMMNTESLIKLEMIQY